MNICAAMPQVMASGPSGSGKSKAMPANGITQPALDAEIGTVGRLASGASRRLAWAPPGDDWSVRHNHHQEILLSRPDVCPHIDFPAARATKKATAYRSVAKGTRLRRANNSKDDRMSFLRKALL